MNWLQDIKVVIFDLDGTLYQDYSFLERYLQHLFKNILPEPEIKEKVAEAYAILEGKHPVRFGYFYNRKNKRVYEHEDLELKKSLTWDGEEDNDLQAEFQDLIYIGDPWVIANLFIDQYGLDEKRCRAAFEQVRQEMLCEPNEIYRHQPLFDQIDKLMVEKKIFMTNTPGPSGPEFVKHLELENLFDDFVYDARKPGGIHAYVEKLIGEGSEPHEILSIGDNPWNDLYPVKQLGGRTCLISKYAHTDPTVWDMSVRTIEELALFLRIQSARLEYQGAFSR